MKIHLATDHAGFEHKEALKAHLLARGLEIVDHGDTKLDENDDYPDFVTPFAVAVAAEPENMGVVFGGISIGGISHLFNKIINLSAGTTFRSVINDMLDKVRNAPS
mgnify:CR=1 FL=1